MQASVLHKAAYTLFGLMNTHNIVEKINTVIYNLSIAKEHIIIVSNTEMS